VLHTPNYEQIVNDYNKKMEGCEKITDGYFEKITHGYFEKIMDGLVPFFFLLLGAKGGLRFAPPPQ